MSELTEEEEDHETTLLEYRLAPNLYIGPSHQLPPSSINTEQRRNIERALKPGTTCFVEGDLKIVITSVERASTRLNITFKEKP